MARITRKRYVFYAAAVALCTPFTASHATSSTSPADPAVEQQEQVSWLTFGTRLGEETVEGFSDLIYPLVGNENNVLFFNPRFSLKDEGANEANIGLGYRRRLADWLVGGANVYFDSRESAHNNRFNQWGAGLEMLTEYVDFRANYYDADNDRKLIGSYTETRVTKSSRTTASSSTSSTTETTFDTSVNGVSEPYAEGNGIYYDIVGEVIANQTTTTTTTTRYRTTTTTTTVNKLFEQFEAGMDGWDAELGVKIPTGSGPEMRLYGGWYDYDNPFGDDISGVKGRLEVRTGEYFTLDAEVFDDEELNGSNYFVGFRLQIPLSADLSWQKFRQGLFSTRQRSLDQRMRGEMVKRDVRIQAGESDWQEDEEKRQVEKKQSVSQRISTSTRTTESTTSQSGAIEQVQVADHITFVDGDTSGEEDGTNEKPYSTIQKGSDNAGDNNTIFVYEAGGVASGKPGAADGGGAYDEQVVLQRGQTLTSRIVWNGGSYQTQNPPVIKPTTITKEKIYTASVGDDIAEDHVHHVAPVISMAADSTVQRMELDTTAPGFVLPFHPGEIRVVAGVFSNQVNTAGNSLTVEESTFINNVTVPSGYFARGIWIYGRNSTDLSVNAARNNITGAGQDSGGIWVSGALSTGLSVRAVENTFIGGFSNSEGIRIFGESSTDLSLSAERNTITTDGIAAEGIFISGDNSTALSVSAIENTITTLDYASDGIHIRSDFSTDFSLSATNNNIITNGEYYTNGIFFSGEGSTGYSLNMTDNTITTNETLHDDTGGILIWDTGTTAPTTNNITGNTLTVNGKSWGILIFDDTNNSFSVPDLQSANLFSLSGDALGDVHKE